MYSRIYCSGLLTVNSLDERVADRRRPTKQNTREGNRKSICFAGGIIVDMLPFCLYFVASVITGFHVYTLLALAVYGAPSNSLELVSLLGSLCLLIAAYVSLFKPYTAARLALIACLAIWCFYGPAIAKSIRPKLGGQSSVLLGRPLVKHQKGLTQATQALSVEPEGGLPWR